MKGLSLQGTVGIDKRQYQQYTYVSHDHKESIDNSRRGGASHKFSKDNRVSIEAYANYHKVFREDHTLDAVAGYSFWQAGGEDFNMANYDFPVDGVGPWDMGVGSYLSEGRATMDSAALAVRPRQLFVQGPLHGERELPPRGFLEIRREQPLG